MRALNLPKLFIVALLAIPFNSAYAGAPFVTDDPEPVEVHHLEVNYALSKTWREGGASASLPSIDFNYGYSTEIQLHAQPKFAYERDGHEVNHGLDNTEIGVKYRFINRQVNDTALMVGIYPMLQLPTGDKKLGGGRGKTQLFLPIWAQYEVADWTFYGGTGYRINNSPDSKNSWFYGATALYQLAPHLQLGGEIFAETATAIGEKGSSGLNLGGIYDLNPKYHVLFSGGKGLSNIASTNQRSVFIALQVIY